MILRAVIARGNPTVFAIAVITESSPSTTKVEAILFLDMNYASAANNSLRLVYGANVKRFSYSPNFRSLRTRAVVIATSIFNGITPTKIWSNFATSALASTYGIIDRVDLQQDIISQSAVSSRANFNLYQSSPEKLQAISVSVVDGSIIPFKNYKIGDDIRVVINRGNVNIDTNLTIRGQQWIGREDGSEEISFEFFNRDQQSYELTPYRAASSLESILRNNDNLKMGNGDQGGDSTANRGPDVESAPTQAALDAQKFLGKYPNRTKEMNVQFGVIVQTKSGKLYYVYADGSRREIGTEQERSMYGLG